MPLPPGSDGLRSGGFIFHRSTPRGEGGVALFDLLGEGAERGLAGIFRPRGKGLPPSGEARLGDIADPAGDIIDEGLVSRVPASGSWHRLESWTLAVHGGPWIQERIGSLLAGLGGEEADARGVLAMAVRGGVMDAIEAAAYELLVEAPTEKAARFFLRQHGGELSGLIREGIALCDAGDLRGALSRIDAVTAGAAAGIRAGHPLRILLAGRPNSGKSTLFNRLLGEERAAVTPIAGTTRDAIEAAAEIHGFPVVLTDSAGLRPLELAGPVERAGIEKARARDDDAVLYLLPPPWRPTPEDEEYLSRIPADRRLLVLSFADRAPPEPRPPVGGIILSAVTGQGLDALGLAILGRWMGWTADPASEIPCAVFTPSQEAILARAAARADLDAIRSAFLECLAASWPEVET